MIKLSIGITLTLGALKGCGAVLAPDVIHDAVQLGINVLVASGAVLYHGGAGANSQFGSGAQAANSLSSSTPPNASSGYGAGGGGGVNKTSQLKQNGGAASAGIVIITEFIG